MHSRPASKRFSARLVLIHLLLILTTCSCFAQESSSKSDNNNTASAPSGPSAALRDALSAACRHSEKDFAAFLTARNRDSFSRMTPATRLSLMKRFVLLDDSGKPSASVNPAGRPIVRCETPIGAAEIQIGGTDLQDNLAFLPVEVRDATDTVGGNVIHIRMGLVLENREWKLLSIGLVLLDLPALEVEWDTAEIGNNEQAAIEAVRRIAKAAEAYRRTYTHLPESLANLGPPLHGPPNGEAAALLDPDLSTGIKSGYTFRYVIRGGVSVGIAAKFEIAATPSTYGRTGRRSFFLDADGKVHSADHQGAVGSEADPKIE